MEKLGKLAEAFNKVMSDLEHFMKRIKEISSREFKSVEEGIHLLSELRTELYEDLNQIQHEYAILDAANWLIKNGRCSPDILWHWNPRQTGTRDESDLEGIEGSNVNISAEVTTSRRPIGSIDKRMQTTLSKLSTASGKKYYFVTSAQMFDRANTKIKKAKWDIEVVQLTPISIESV